MQTYTAQEYFDFCEKIGEWGRLFEFADEQIQDKTAGKTVPAEIVNLVLQSNNIDNFFNIYKITMSSNSHQLTTNNVQSFLLMLLFLKGYRVYAEGCRICIKATNSYRIPDVLVTDLEKEIRNTDNQVENPLLVIEILSPSTSKIDLNQKLAEYQNIPDLQSYIIIWQDQPKILQHYKEGNHWLKSEYEGIEDVLNIDFLEIMLPLAVVYKGVKFEN